MAHCGSDCVYRRRRIGRPPMQGHQVPDPHSASNEGHAHRPVWNDSKQPLLSRRQCPAWPNTHSRAMRCIAAPDANGHTCDRSRRLA